MIPPDPDPLESLEDDTPVESLAEGFSEVMRLFQVIKPLLVDDMGLYYTIYTYIYIICTYIHMYDIHIYDNIHKSNDIYILS